MATLIFRLIDEASACWRRLRCWRGVSLDAAAAGNRGVLYFQTGKSLSNFHFIYGSGASAVQQDFALSKGCTVELDSSISNSRR